MDWLDKIEHFLIILVSRLAPWAAPLAPAYLVARVEAHNQDYGMHFRLVKAWGVRNRYQAERVALEMTRHYHFNEGSRRELRKMTWLQSRLFIRSFSRKRKGSV